MKRRAYIGLGSNQGDTVAALMAAVDALKSIEQSEFVAVSSMYKTAPIDAPGPDFLNAVACIDTELDPYSLLLHLLDIERMLGRKRRGGEKNAPRKADLDLLLVDNLILHSTPLTLPHPRLRERAFALQPLLEIAPDAFIPGVGTATDLLAAISDQRIERIDASIPVLESPAPVDPAASSSASSAASELPPQ